MCAAAAEAGESGINRFWPNRMLRNPAIRERIGAVVEITGGFAAESDRVGGLAASVSRRPRHFRGA
jgi:hypothetical protein